MSVALRLLAPAKLNLALRVHGRRPDGYHELETVFCAIDLCDVLVAARTPGHGIALDVIDAAGRGLPVASGADNLVVRAARAVLESAGADVGVRFHLEKRIPAGGGLGGGSSDAAAALRLTNALLGEPLDAATLDRLALGLGADVPFFLRGAACFAGGVGERLVPIELPQRYAFVLVLPPFGTSTARVFELLGARLIEPAALARFRRIEPPTATEIALTLRQGNDLEEAAMQCTAGLRSLRDGLREVVRGAGLDAAAVRMSGSGSTLFVACASDSGDAARAQADAVLAAWMAAGARPEFAGVATWTAAEFGRLRAPEPAAWPGPGGAV